MKVNYTASDKTSNPTAEKGMKVEYAAAKRGAYKARWYLLLSLVLLPILLVIWVVVRPQVLVLATGLITTDPIELRAPAAATVHNLAVTEGQVVTKGQRLLTLNDPQLNAQIIELQRQLSELAQPTVIADTDILQQRQGSIQVASDSVAQQTEYLQSYQNFKRTGLVSTHEMAAVQQTLTNAKLALDQAKVDAMQLQQLQQVQRLAGPVETARRALLLQLAQFEAQQNALHITAPNDSKVIDISVKPGEYIQQDLPMLIISNRTTPVIFAYLQPKHMNYAQIGLKASVTLPNGDKVNATVTGPVELLERLPAKLAGPFDGEQAVLKVTLTPDQPVPAIEGLPVELSFDLHW
jgi:multidrug resistance efflux pump